MAHNIKHNRFCLLSEVKIYFSIFIAETEELVK